MKSQKKESKGTGSKWLRRAGIALFILLFAPVLLFTIGWFSRDLLIDGLQEWYNDNNSGSLEIGEVDATFLKGFPNAGFTIRDIYQTGFDSILDKRSSIFIKEAQVTIAAKDLMQGNIRFKTIDINQARIFTEVDTDKSIEQYKSLKKLKQADPKNGIELPGWLDPARTNFVLREVSFISKDTMLNKYFNLKVAQAYGRLRRNRGDIIGSLDFKIMVNALGFNTTKGSYINGAMVEGSPRFIMNKENTMISIPDFLLNVGEQKFITNAEFDFKGTNSYNFSLKNPETDFQHTKDLLPANILEKIDPYTLLQPLNLDFNLRGEFKYGDIPYIDAEFSTLGNKLNIGDSIQLENVNLNGYLTNTLSLEDSLTNKTPGRRDIKIYFEALTANSEDIKLSVADSYFQSSEEALNFVSANLKLSGSNETLSRLMQTDNFDFIGGDFALNTRIKGDIPNLPEVFNYANGNFILRNTRVVLQKNNLQLPVETIALKLNNKNSVLEQLKINLPNGEHLLFTGNIENASALIASDPAVAASADVKLDSESININDLIATAQEFIPESEKTGKNLTTLHETLEAIYKKFQPNFQLDINSVQYNEVTFNELLADIDLLNAETIQLNNFSFNYNNAVTNLKGALKIPEPYDAVQEPIFLNVEASSSGPISVFQDLFNIQLLDIKAGDFNFEGNVTGNVQEFQQLLNNANGDLQLSNTKFYYPKAQMDIELDSINVMVYDSNISLKHFVVEIDEHHPFTLHGRVEQFPRFLLDNIESKGRIFLEMDATYVNMDDWLHTFHSIEPGATNKSLKNRELAAIFADIYKFDPEFKVDIDSIKYKNLLTEDLAAKVYFENDSILKLDDLRVSYKNSKAVIAGQLSAHYIEDIASKQNPFNFEFKADAWGKSQDLNELLKTVNFTLRSGDFRFNASYKGEAQDLEILNSDIQGDLRLASTKVDIEGTDIQIPIDSLHLMINNNMATLDKLDVDLPGKSAIDITGQIDNFSNFINNDQAIDAHTSSFVVKSPYLDSRDIKEFIGDSGKDRKTDEKQKLSIKDLKEIIRNINYSYFPSVSVEIDSLIYEDLGVSGFSSNIGFNDSGAIRIADTQLDYFGGSVNFTLEAAVASPENLPVKIEMDIENIDFEKLVKDLDYFKIEDLRNTEKISGNLDLKLDVTGIIKRDGKINMNTLNGTAQVSLNNLALYDFKPIIESVVLLREERFEKLQFRPITLNLKVENGNIMIPRTQLQSTALQVFVEGQLKIGEYYNVWLSLPWNNILKSRDGIELPEKLSFEESGAKFYIQLVEDKDSDKSGKTKIKSRFRLSNRKLEKIKEN